jgi:hypothetical protein
VNIPAGSACSNEQEKVSPPPPTRDLVGQGCVDTVIHDQLALASDDDAQAQLENDKVLHLAPIGEPMPTVSLTVERGGSSVNKTATCENRDMSSSDALQAMNDEHIRHSRPVKDAVHQEDAPYVEERKGLVVGRGIAKTTNIKRDGRQVTFARIVAGARNAPVSHVERMKSLVIGRGKVTTKRTERPGTFVRTVEGANDVPASNVELEKDERQETFTPVVAGENHTPALNVRRNERSETFTRSAAGARGAPAFRIKETKDLVIGRGTARNTGVKGNERQQTFVRGVAGTDCAPAPRHPLPAPNNNKMMRKLVSGQVSRRGNGASKNKQREMLAQAVAGAESAPAHRRPSPASKNVEENRSSTRTRGKENERQRMFVRDVAGAESAPARRRPLPVLGCAKTKRKLVNRLVPVSVDGDGRNERPGTFARAMPVMEKNERQMTFIQSAASAGCTPASRVKETTDLVIGRGRARSSGIERNERQDTFARVVASADSAPARRSTSPALDLVETMRKLVVGRALVRENGASKNERQGTFARTVAGANSAPARRGVLRTSKNIEEIHSSTKKINKRRAAHATLPRATQMNYLPGSQVQTSSKARQRPSRGYYLPSLTSSSPNPVDGQRRNASVG